jgi:LuxR family maltose regulon positive regulatory protein
VTDHPTVPIRRTKLYRPPVTADLLERAELTGQLDAGRPLPLTLVSAPAGYGKSTLVSQWLENTEVPSTWLSLEESDGDIGIFLQYCAAAIRSHFPNSCAETMAMLAGDALPPANVLAIALCNDIDAIEETFILVLDEYHRVSSPEVHELLDEFLQHPPRNLNLVIISRRNPPLSLSSLRSRNRVTEIRMQVLQFSSAESIAYLQHALGDSIDAVDLARIHDATEGWPAGLGLAAIALRQGRNTKEFIDGLMSGSSRIQTYLIEEVLSHQPVSIKENLYRVSILERFNAPLCEAICTDSKDEFSGEQFITSLLDAGLLCIALDGHGEWYRLHQMFRDLLRAQLVELVDDAEVTRLHECASHWLAGSGLKQEAMQHFVASKNIDAAVEYMASIRHGLMNVENWLHLSRLLSLFTAEQIEQYAILLLIRAWIKLHYLYDIPAMINDVELVTGILETETDHSGSYTHLKSELDAFRSLLLLYYVRAEEAVDLAQKALEGLGPEQESARGMALMALGAGYQLRGH